MVKTEDTQNYKTIYSQNLEGIIFHLKLSENVKDPPPNHTFSETT